MNDGQKWRCREEGLYYVEIRNPDSNIIAEPSGYYFRISTSDDSDTGNDSEEIETDIDSDGVADDQDNCIEIANPDQSDLDGDGFGDACDGCPGNPQKTEPGLCGCGTADADGDGSDIADCLESEETTSSDGGGGRGGGCFILNCMD